MSPFDSSPSDSEPAAIAARYGATLRPGVSVTRLPMGATAFPPPVWDGVRLTYQDDAQRNVLRTRDKASYHRPQSPAVIARRAALRALHDQGLTVRQMMAATGHSEYTVRHDLAVMKLPAHAPAVASVVIATRTAQERYAAAWQARLGVARDLAAKGAGLAEIAAALDVSTKTCSVAMKRFGIVLQPRPKWGPVNRAASEAKAARHAEVRRLHGQGLDARAIAGVLSVSVASIRKDLCALRLTTPRADAAALLPAIRKGVEAGKMLVEVADDLGVNRHVIQRMALRAGIKSPGRAAGLAARRAKVAKMRKAGKMIAEICAALQVSDATVLADLRVLGLTGKAPPRGLAADRPDLVAEAARMRGQGASVYAIGKALRLDDKAVRRLLAAADRVGGE